MHTYRPTQNGRGGPRLYTVGFFDATIGWQALRDCTSEAQAISLVSHLNGGTGRVPLDPLFVAATPHPGDTITLHLARGDTGMLQVYIVGGLCVPIVVPAGEALSIANDGLGIIIAREAK